MSSCDALISDYSSSAYSFLLLDKPIGFVVEDINTYKLGFSVSDFERFLVGEKIFSYKDLERFLSNIISGIDNFVEERKQLLEWMYDFCDGNACKRLIHFLSL